MQRSNGDTRDAWLMLAPFLCFFALFVLYPLAANVYYSFTNYNLTDNYKFVGLRKYLRCFGDAAFLKALSNTAMFALVSVVSLTAVGFLAAAALNRTARGVKWLRTLLLFPYATSMAAVSMIWLMMYDPTTGFLNKALRALGLPAVKWLFDPSTALGSLIFVNVWKNIGYCMLIYLAGMQAIPRDVYEAGTVDGASEWTKLIHITLPMIRQVAFFVLVTTTVESFKTFEQVQVMTRGDPLYATTTIVHQIYMRGFSEFKMGYASAMAVLLLIIVLAVTLMSDRLNRRLD